jgi:hypothetical protein
LTLHAYRSRSRIAELEVSRVALELPQAGEPTLWGAMDARQRKALVLTLQEVFRRGHYVDELTDEGRAGLRPGQQVRWDNALLAAHLADQPLNGGWDELLDKWPDADELRRQRALFERYRDDPDKNRPLGISPRRLLAAAHAGWDSAICRDVNQALVGLLLELGVPAAQLRLVAGGASAEPRAVRHLFAEVQLEPGGPWLELDGTPGASDDGPSLRARFPHAPREFPRFFEPIPVRER